LHLQDSLGGNSKTVMIATISPSTQNITETQSTLRFAQRAKKMGNKAHVNENASGDIERLRREVVHLRQQLAQRDQQLSLGGAHALKSDCASNRSAWRMSGLHAGSSAIVLGACSRGVRCLAVRKRAGAQQAPAPIAFASPIDVMHTPVLSPAAPGAEPSPARQQATPNKMSLAALVGAIERATLAERRVTLCERKQAGLQEQVEKLMAVRRQTAA
jgi:Kinesin motor domain